MTWLTLLKGVLVAAVALASWLKNRGVIEAGRAEIIAENLEAALDEIAQANAARDSVRLELDRDPSSLRNDDGFKRSD